jgi:hypothetical protein
MITSTAHPAFLKKDGSHGFLNCIVVPLLQQYKLRTSDGHLASKMWDELGLYDYTFPLSNDFQLDYG